MRAARRGVVSALAAALLLQVITLIHGDDITEMAADRGSNVSLPCGDDGPGLTTLPNVMWIHEGHSTHYPVVAGSLHLKDVNTNHSGLYECVIENETAYTSRINLTIRTEPPPLVNVTVHASTILALILWNVAGDGGHPIIDFTAQYRAAKHINGTLEDWRPISPNHISPNSRQIDVYHLEPNASYWFRVWATNALGPGPAVEVVARTLFVDQDAELYKHFLSGLEQFDVRTWIAAVAVVMGTLVVLAAGTCYVLCREWRDGDDYGDEQDVMELVPNIILNPGFVDDSAERRDPDVKTYAVSIVKSSECPGPGKPRKV